MIVFAGFYSVVVVVNEVGRVQRERNVTDHAKMRPLFSSGVALVHGWGMERKQIPV